jgi:hypothetical protein
MNYWNQIGVPHKGWQNMGFEDLLEPTHKCDMCGREEIRYVHTMRHKEVDRNFMVGQVCAEHMTNDYTTAKEQLTYMKNRSVWANSRWNRKYIHDHEYEEKSTNAYNSRYMAFVFLHDSHYHIGLDDHVFSTTFDTKHEAKKFLYDLIKKSNT